MTLPSPRVLQIIPASGWRWRLKSESDAEARPLTCLALVEVDWNDGQEPERTIEGVDLTCDFLYGLVSEMDAVVYLPPATVEPIDRKRGGSDATS
jgi:hypothetical protein